MTNSDSCCVTGLTNLPAGICITAGIVASLASFDSRAADAHAATRPQMHNSHSVIVLSAAPRENQEAGRERYTPIAQHLSQALGKPVEYEHPGNWLSYQSNMIKGKYDIVFDDAHLNDYRATKLGHTIVAKSVHSNRYALVVKRSSKHYNNAGDLSGRSVCANAAPSLATLHVLQKYDNPSRQPRIVNSTDWQTIYTNVVNGTCVAGLLPVAALGSLDRNNSELRAVFTTEPLPAQAFSAGPRLSSVDKKKLSDALTSDSANDATRILRDAYYIKQGFSQAGNADFRGMSALLHNEFGF